jgi:hypothetical protein
MRWWHPEPDQPELLDWYRPLLVVARKALDDEYPWCVHVQDFRVVGRVRRQGRPDVWVYACPEGGGELYVDDAGATYKFIPTPNGKGVGQFRPLDFHAALWRCGVPYAVQPSLRDPLPEPPAYEGWEEPSGRPHLRVVQ